MVSYLARGDVALSMAMTSVSTLLAPIMTPLLTLWLAGEHMNVSAGAMAMSIVQMVLIPVVGGLIVRLLLPGFGAAHPASDAVDLGCGDFDDRGHCCVRFA